MYHSSNQKWCVRKLNPAEEKKGEIIRQINYLIVNFVSIKGTEDDANMILDLIYLGNQYVAHDINFIIAYGIKNVINVSNGVPNIFPFVSYMTSYLKDEDACRMNTLPLMEEGADLINQSVSQNAPILIHCKRGHHRSASIIAFYLMKYHQLSLYDAVYLIKKCRPTAFRRMTCMLKTLIDYESKIN